MLVDKTEMLDNDTISKSRKPRGLTDILVSEADIQSIPPPGAELLREVGRAKSAGEVPMIYDSSVIRYINGKWMVPQMCDRFVHTLCIERPF
jgi:hypothetical protein